MDTLIRETPRSAASDLGMSFLSMPHKKDARLLSLCDIGLFSFDLIPYVP